MCTSLYTVVACAMGTLVVSVTSILIYQWVTVVQVVVPSPPPPPPMVQTVPPGMVEPMELDTAKPAGRLLPMPSTGRE